MTSEDFGEFDYVFAMVSFLSTGFALDGIMRQGFSFVKSPS